jgi:hypothetical protein
MAVQELHLMWSKCHNLIQEDRVHGGTTVIFVTEEILVLLNAKMLLR